MGTIAAKQMQRHALWHLSFSAKATEVHVY